MPATIAAPLARQQSIIGQERIFFATPFMNNTGQHLIGQIKITRFHVQLLFSPRVSGMLSSSISTKVHLFTMSKHPDEATKKVHPVQTCL